MFCNQVEFIKCCSQFELYRISTTLIVPVLSDAEELMSSEPLFMNVVNGLAEMSPVAKRLVGNSLNTIVKRKRYMLSLKQAIH